MGWVSILYEFPCHSFMRHTHPILTLLPFHSSTWASEVGNSRTCSVYWQLLLVISPHPSSQLLLLLRT